MHNLLNENTLRIIKLIELLYNNYPDTTSIKEAAEYNHCSHKTVLDDIEAINKLNHLRIKPTIKNNLIKIDNTNFNTRDIFIVKSGIINHDLNVTLLLELFFNPKKRIVDYAEYLHYSPSTIRHYFNRLNTFFKSKGMYVHRSASNTYSIKSDNAWKLGLLLYDLIRTSANQHYIDDVEVDYQDVIDLLPGYFNEHIPETIIVELKSIAKIDHLASKLYSGYDRTPENIDLKEIFVLKEDILIDYISRFALTFNRSLNRESLCNNFVDQALNIFKYCAFKAKYNPSKVDNILNRYDKFVEVFEDTTDTLIEPLKLLIDAIEKELNIEFLDYASEVKFNFYILVLPLLVEKSKASKLIIAINSDFGALHTEYLLSLIQYYIPFYKYVKYSDDATFDLLVCTGSFNNKINKNLVVLVNDYLSFEHIIELQRNIMIKAKELRIIKTIDEKMSIKKEYAYE